MIAFLKGILSLKSGSACLVDVGGVGYEVLVSQNTFARLPSSGEAVQLHTYFHVREDAQQLYGFAMPAEKEAFCLLLKVKGVGPKVALGILSSLNAADLGDAIRKKRLPILVAVPGVGKKLAERLILELSDKVEGLGNPSTTPSAGLGAGSLANGDILDQVAGALQALGIPGAQARQAASRAYGQLGAEAKVEEAVKAALKYI